MDIKVYKLKDTETGLYNSGGDRWSKKGKAWTAIAHLKTKLTGEAQEFAYYGNGRYNDIRYDKSRRKELIERYIPKTWVIIEFSNEGVREIIPADIYKE